MHALHQSGQIILKTLNEAGYEAYFVGGYVRDYLLAKKSDDIDITTNATPETVQSLFERTILTGKAFGTITVLINDNAFEVTTYRKETHYDNHRHPNSISFASSIEEDLSRRDFTINQLIMDKDNQIQDHHNGLGDIEAKIIKTIGKATQRFEEDALRMLRAFRFSAQLDFEIDNDTLQAIKLKQTHVSKISVERILNELIKLLDAKHSQKALKAMVSIDFHKALNIEKGLKKLSTLQGEYDHLIAFALLHSVEEIPQETFKFSNKLYKHFTHISTIHKKTFKQGFKAIDVFDYGKFNCLHANTLNHLLGDQDRSEEIITFYNTLPIKHAKALNINGNDLLKNFDIKDKTHISKTLRKLLILVVNQTIDNKQETLLKQAKTILEALKDSE